MANGLAKSWDEFFGQLLASFLANNEKYDITLRKDGDLFYWVEEQKEEFSKYARGEPSSMTGNRVQKLRSVNFPFGTIRSKRKIAVDGKSWEEMFAELLQFRIFQKSWNVPPSNQQLFHWVGQQRALYHQPRGGLSPVQKLRIKKLQMVRFPFFITAAAPQAPVLQQAVNPQFAAIQYQVAANNSQPGTTVPFPAAAVAGMNPQFPFLSRRFPFLNPALGVVPTARPPPARTNPSTATAAGAMDTAATATTSPPVAVVANGTPTPATPAGASGAPEVATTNSTEQQVRTTPKANSEPVTAGASTNETQQ